LVLLFEFKAIEYTINVGLKSSNGRGISAWTKIMRTYG